MAPTDDAGFARVAHPEKTKKGGPQRPPFFIFQPQTHPHGVAGNPSDLRRNPSIESSIVARAALSSS